MRIFTIGFTKKSANTFFELIKTNGIKTLIDIRLNNSSQLAGFSKGSDLQYFLQEICGCGYRHELVCAPTKELMDSFKAGKMPWNQFEKNYTQLLEERDALQSLGKYNDAAGSICLLCSEETPEHCHRRILADLLAERYPGTPVQHL